MIKGNRAIKNTQTQNEHIEKSYKDKKEKRDFSDLKSADAHI